MDIDLDASHAARLAALKAATPLIAERRERIRQTSSDGRIGQAPEARTQQEMARHGVIMAAEAQTRLAHTILASAGVPAGRMVDIRV